MSGRISLLVDSPLRTVIAAMSGLDAEVRKQIQNATKAAGLPIWQESTRAQASTRMQVRLADSARVGVTARNVVLRAGAVGTLSSGAPLSRIAKAIEFGAHPDTPIKTRSRTGTPYTRRLGRGFRLPRSRGYVAHPAAAESAIRRLASLLVQTTVRTVHEQIEKAADG